MAFSTSATARWRTLVLRRGDPERPLPPIGFGMYALGTVSPGKRPCEPGRGDPEGRLYPILSPGGRYDRTRGSACYPTLGGAKSATFSTGAPACPTVTPMSD